MIKLRPYQVQLKTDVRRAWSQGARNVCMRLGTGGGKTTIFGDMTQEHPGYSCLIAHRQELIKQISLALARIGVVHNIIAPSKILKGIVAEHLAELGRSYYSPGARCAVASVDTLNNADGLNGFFAQVTFWIVDEAHHLILDNKWHTAVQKFTNPHCLGLGPTATPERADGKGLGRHADGVFDVMVHGPPERWLIDQGYLTDYRVICAESDLEEFLGAVGASGDWSPAQLKAAAAKSHIVGDIVTNYVKFARGAKGITFSTDVDTAVAITQRFRAAGVRAETLTGKTDPNVRRQMLRQYEAGEVEELVAVDIVSEGFDVPAMIVGSSGRPTESLGLFMQQFGRLLRPLYAPGYDLETQAGRLAAIAAGPKPVALWIDHAGNFLRHGPPDRPRVWTLDRREKRSRKSDAIPLRACLSCFQPFERYRVTCPWCETRVEPEGRSSPAMVEGDMCELDADTLARLRGEAVAMTRTIDEYREYLATTGLPSKFIMANVKDYAARQEALAALRDAMAWWGGQRTAEGLSDREIQKLFFLRFGVDVLTAQALTRSDADVLRVRLTAASG